MSIEKRRAEILKIIKNSGEKPTTASTLAMKFQVTRSVIVGDIAVLRAAGNNIVSTAKGYILGDNKRRFEYVGSISTKHSKENIEDELFTIIELGASVLDVSIYHTVYGEISVNLDIHNMDDAKVFVEAMRNDTHGLLGSLTDGIHTHTIGCSSKRVFDIVKQELSKLDIIVE